MKERGLKQIDAADLFGVTQPEVSKMLRGEFRQFPSNVCCVSWLRSIRMSRSWSNRIAAGTTQPPYRYTETFLY